MYMFFRLRLYHCVGVNMKSHKTAAAPDKKGTLAARILNPGIVGLRELVNLLWHK